jgi:hypothetical protein
LLAVVVCIRNLLCVINVSVACVLVSLYVLFTCIAVVPSFILTVYIGIICSVINIVPIFCTILILWIPFTNLIIILLLDFFVGVVFHGLLAGRPHWWIVSKAARRDLRRTWRHRMRC